MNLQKQVLAEIPLCYAVGKLDMDGGVKLVFASEGHGGSCCAFGGDHYEKKEIIWHDVGGTVSFVQIPNTNGEFLAVVHFYPTFNASKSNIVWGKCINGTWTIHKFLDLPYAHRIDVIESGERRYFIGATLSRSKKYTEDWSDPGEIWVGELPDDWNGSMELKCIKGQLVKNHGYSRSMDRNGDVAYLSSESGLYQLVPPRLDADWSIRQLLEGRISDAIVLDIDEDGIDEVVTIEPFHGDRIYIKKLTGQTGQEVYSYPHKTAFAHAIWGGRLLGKPAIIVGMRQVNKELSIITYDKTRRQYKTTIVEEGVGTANVTVVKDRHNEIIVAANQAVSQAAIYYVNH